jgi:hypothetical protein
MINEPLTTNHELRTRPASVWIAQVILGLLGAIWGLAGLLNIYYIMIRPGPGDHSILNIASMISSIVFSIVFIIGLEGLARRKNYGRWIAVAGLSLVFVGGVLNSFARFGRYRSPAESLGALTIGLVLFGLLGFLVYRLARGGPANAFFKQDEQDL